MKLDRSTIIAIAAGGLAALLLYAIYMASAAQAADLGGNCCTDLEERIADLEATAARKGNRKISLRVYGQVNKAIAHWSGDIPSDTVITENSADESFVGFAGEAKISNGLTAGYVLEIGVGGYDDSLKSGTGYGPLFSGDTNGVYTLRSFAFVDSQQLGRLSVGLQSQATDGIVEMTTANTRPAMRALSFRPITGPQILEVLDLWDGTRDDLIRYDSPTFGGAVISASWTTGSFGTDDVFDVALRWQGEGNGFRALAGIGYRNGIVVPTIGAFGSSGSFDPEIISGSASIKHMETGLFVTGAGGRIDLGFADVTSWEITGGIERGLTSLGLTTIYGDYSDWGDLDVKWYGLGVVQHIDAAAADVYLTGRKYDIGSDSATQIMGGMKVQF